MTEPDLPRPIRDPDGRMVAFTARSWQHIQSVRPELLNELDAITSTISQPVLREPDPQPGRERFYRQHVTDRIRWMRVVVDFNTDPAVIVTAFVQRKKPNSN